MSLTLLLRCRSLAETRAYYRDILGFAVADTAGKTLTAEKEGGTLIFVDQDFLGTPAMSATIYFTLADADAYFAVIKDKVAIAWPLQNMPYGTREFGITDCNGYCLAFQQNMSVHRSHNADLTGATFTDVKLAGSRFEDVSLSQAAFTNVSLAGAVITAANLTGMTFTDVKLAGGRFEDVNLFQAVFTNVNLAGAAVTDANLTGMTINGILVSDLIQAYENRDK
jgi:uncharacterized protein YjbI with pentapeptide repeats